MFYISVDHGCASVQWTRDLLWNEGAELPEYEAIPLARHVEDTWLQVNMCIILIVPVANQLYTLQSDMC